MLYMDLSIRAATFLAYTVLALIVHISQGVMPLIGFSDVVVASFLAATISSRFDLRLGSTAFLAFTVSALVVHLYQGVRPLIDILDVIIALFLASTISEKSRQIQEEQSEKS